MDASQNITSAAGDFEVSVTVEVDPEAMQAETVEMFAGRPTKVTGSFAAGQDPQALGLALKTAVADQEMALGFKMVGATAYLSLGDAWYQLPAEFTGPLSGAADSQTDAQMVQRLLADTGIDPSTWITDLKLLGQETVAGTTCYHLAGAPDLRRVVGDLLKLLESESFRQLLEKYGGNEVPSGPASLLPPAAELDALLDQIADAFQELAFDVWVAKDTYLLRKAAFNARVVPPVGEQREAISSVSLSGVLNLDPNAKVEVTAPATALPFNQLQEDMKDNPGLFGPFLGGLGNI